MVHTQRLVSAFNLSSGGVAPTTGLARAVRELRATRWAELPG